MRREEQCNLYWLTLRTIWKASDPGRDHIGNHNDNYVDDLEGERNGAFGAPPLISHCVSTESRCIGAVLDHLDGTAEAWNEIAHKPTI